MKNHDKDALHRALGGIKKGARKAQSKKDSPEGRGFMVSIGFGGPPEDIGEGVEDENDKRERIAKGKSGR